jgi:hypothetical protein
MSAQCKSCGAAIVWAESITGRPMPFDAQPAVNGRWVIVVGKARLASPEDKILHRDMYNSHFTTCPQADAWRKRSP